MVIELQPTATPEELAAIRKIISHDLAEIREISAQGRSFGQFPGSVITLTLPPSVDPQAFWPRPRLTRRPFFAERRFARRAQRQFLLARGRLATAAWLSSPTVCR